MYQLSELRPEDRNGLLQMFARCSSKTRYDRFMTFAADAGSEHVDLLLRDQESLSLVLRCGSRVVGVGSLFFRGPSLAEIALLVEDEFQGRGAGRVLATGLCEHAADRGLSRLELTLLAGNTRIVRLFRSIVSDARFTPADAGVVTGNLQLAA
jgi:GNAT superfamily N-acetyltransferase